MRKLLLLAICVFGVGTLYAQQGSLSNLRERTIEVPEGRQTLDSLTIAASSVLVKAGDTLLDTSYYRIDNNDIVWQKPVAGPVVIRYRVLPYDLGRPIARLDTAQLQRDTVGAIIGLRYNPYERDNPLVDFKGLDYSGSFSRGVSFGNSQDLVLNSSFNLQLAGNLGDGIEILAAITDENIPLQAEGNTQQLREFDKIFIQLKKGNTKLIAGDYELQRPASYFMNYFKKLQGATFSTQQTLGKGLLSTNASLAVSRGQFARNQLSQQEGNQGPYRLEGSQGERFIIILAGTERVWLDGQLLLRGLEGDYVIDYNRGELTFTSRRLITKDSRIIIEFEYADQSYLRSLYAFNVDYQMEGLRLYVNAFSQQDSRTSTGDQQLTDTQKRVLRDAGDDLSRAVVSTIDTVESTTAVRATYALRTAIWNCNGQDTSIQYLAYTTNPDSGRYVARFSLVGTGRGDYVLDTEQSANERVYRWVPPDPATCQRRGDYAPITQLTAPEQQQLFTAGAEWKLPRQTLLRTEIAMSRRDQNRFSSLDSGDDLGLAGFATLSRDFRLGSDSIGWTLNTQASYEFTQQNFKALNPYRSQEFLRDWNIANVQGVGSAPAAGEHLGRAALALRRAGWGQVGYELSIFLRDTLYNGLRHGAMLQFQRNNWHIEGQSSWLQTSETLRRTSFSRPKIQLSRTFPALANWRLSLQGEREKSERREGDILEASSFYYDRYGVFLQSPDTAAVVLGLNASRRTDYAPVAADFRRSTDATEFNVNGQWSKLKGLQTALLFSYRRLDIADTTLTPQRAGATFLSRFDVGAVAWKGALRSTTTYEITSGQEPQIAFTYVKVAQGSGTHIWLDSLFNNDGKIQLNEMEIAPFPDQADYVRVSLYTNEFIRTNNVNINQSLLLDPRPVWQTKKGFKKWLSRFSTQSTFNLTRKTRQADGIQPWNPFQLAIADTALVSLNSTIRNTLFFDRANPRYDLQLGQSDNRNRIVQTTGYEARRLSEYLLRGRWNAGTTVSLVCAWAQGQRESDSEFFNNKDYRLLFTRIEPQVTYLPNKNFRVVGGYKYQFDRNTLGDRGEKATQHQLSVEATLNRSAQSQLRLRVSYIRVIFEGEAATPVGFAILNGLQNGRNWLWNLGLNRQLSRNLTLSLSYEGRQTGESKTVHVGRAQVSALF
jgi:hypothetical protein